MKNIKNIAAAISKDGGMVEIHLDVESTSLNGIGFAFGAIVRQGQAELGEVAALALEGANMVANGGEREGFVRKDILPHLGDLPQVETLTELRELWLTLYFAVKNRVMELNGIKPWETGALRRKLVVVIDNGIPVEALFNATAMEARVVAAEQALRMAVDAEFGDKAEADKAYADRYFGAVTVIELGGFYMPRDISTALEEMGYNPDLPRSKVAEALGITGTKHHPVVDARQSMAVYDAAKRRDPVLDTHKL